MSGSPVYFAHHEGKQLGPLSFAALDALSVNGELLPTDLVWESGTPEWIPASTLLSFAPPPVAAVVSSAAVAASDFRAAPGPPVRPASRVAGRFRGWVDHLSTFSFAELFPIPRLFDAETLGGHRSWMLLLFGVLPLLLGTVVEDPLLRVRLFNLGCGVLWTLFFVVAYRPEGESLRLGIALFFASAVLGILFFSVLNGLPPLKWIDPLLAPERPAVVRILASILGIGMLQELGKAAVLLLLLRTFGGLRHPTEGVYYGLLTGLGFGVWAAVASAGRVDPRPGAVFALFSGPPTLGLYAYLVSSVVRMAALPFLHAVWSAVVGYYVGLSAKTTESTETTHAPVALGIFVAATLHGLYDLFQSSGRDVLALLVAALSALFFLVYFRAAETVQAERAKA